MNVRLDLRKLLLLLNNFRLRLRTRGLTRTSTGPWSRRVLLQALRCHRCCSVFQGPPWAYESET